MTFTIDTSGYVIPTTDLNQTAPVVWSDLSPFTQGYVEALFGSLVREKDWGSLKPVLPHPLWPGAFKNVSFSDLAPETLARIIADCEAFQATHAYADMELSSLHEEEEEAAGSAFWDTRQRNEYSFDFALRTGRGSDWPKLSDKALQAAAEKFPPLTVQLGEDGKVRFA